MTDRCDIAVVTGGRKYQITAADRAWLDEMLDLHGFRLLLHGDASGVDRDVAAWGRSRKLCVAACPAEWEAFRKRYGRPHGAGPARNMRMAWALKPMRAVALVFPGNTGTANMVECCTRMGIRIRKSPTAADPQQALIPGI